MPGGRSTVCHGDGQTERLTCRFLLMCSGYYDYAQGHAPAFAGAERFAGPVVHPQAWPDGPRLGRPAASS